MLYGYLVQSGARFPGPPFRQDNLESRPDPGRLVRRERTASLVLGAFEGCEFGIDTIEHSVTVKQFTALGRLPALFDLLPDLFLTKRDTLVQVLKQAQSPLNHFIGRMVPARLDLALHELFEFRSQFDVHRSPRVS